MKRAFTRSDPIARAGLTFSHGALAQDWVSSATYHPNEVWVKQQARNVLMWLEDHGIKATHLIRDRDTKFTVGFDQLLKTQGIKVVKSPVMAPDANAYAEAWVGSIKRECLNYFACFRTCMKTHLTPAPTDEA